MSACKKRIRNKCIHVRKKTIYFSNKKLASDGAMHPQQALLHWVTTKKNGRKDHHINSGKKKARFHHSRTALFLLTWPWTPARPARPAFFPPTLHVHAPRRPVAVLHGEGSPHRIPKESKSRDEEKKKKKKKKSNVPDHSAPKSVCTEEISGGHGPG